ncbi:uncharacterized protein LOC105945479 isoform X1 [Xenopus tropicalis]|uniref:Uncharacterized protein LOC105945479 isoform X1 n=1 Tax=Xenopus tropicalis TaxID=8364 RepID=A0A8J0S5W2_XENTR|nr:uncharacterized protein LOC105945479 isoform X1 [Xenopus tropicalis]
MEGRIGAPKRRVLCPRRFRDEEDWAMFRSSGTKRKVTFLSTGEGSRRRQKLMDGSIGGRRGKRSIAEDCDEGSVQEEEGAGNPGEEVSRDLDDVTSAGRGREAAESPGDTAKSAHNPAESPIRSVMPQPSPREPTTLPTITNDLGSAALGANPSPLPPPHGNPNNPAPKGAEGDGAANFPRSTRTPRGPGRRAVPGQARGGKAKNKIRPRVQTASTSSSFQYPPSPEHNRTATTRGHWEEEEADDAEWGREPVPTLPRQRSLFPRGGGNSRPGRAGEYSFLRVPNHRGLPRRPWGDNHWERDDSCYVVGGYYDDYVDDYDTVDVFPSSSQKYRQRRPESRMCYVNDGVPSFYFRNREEEDSWFQWRKERELRRQEEEGSSRGPEGEGRASASADGRTTQKKEEVPGRTVAATAGDPLLEELCERSVSEKTLSSYKKAWERWQLFCKSGKSKQGKKELLSFLMVLYREGKSKAAASTALAAISHFSIAKGRPEITHDPLIRKIMKGWARMEGTRRDKREPIIEDRLEKILEVLAEVCSDQYECILFRAAFTLAFGGAFRISELVPPSKKVRDKGLMNRRVLLQEGKVLVYIDRSKTDQLGKGRWVCIEQTSRATCPVKALQEYMKVRPAEGLLLLIHKDSSPMSAFQFRQVLKKAVMANGWDTNKFGSHSLRIGAATEAAMRGDSVERIKKIGRWQSKAYRKYIRPINVAN